MANATVKAKVVHYTLELDEEEAGVLMAVLNCIGGDQRTSPRRHTNEIYRALASAGAEKHPVRFDDRRDTLYFAE